jgi:hypothetical protein
MVASAVRWNDACDGVGRMRVLAFPFACVLALVLAIASWPLASLRQLRARRRLRTVHHRGILLERV